MAVRLMHLEISEVKERNSNFRDKNREEIKIETHTHTQE